MRCFYVLISADRVSGPSPSVAEFGKIPCLEKRPVRRLLPGSSAGTMLPCRQLGSASAPHVRILSGSVAAQGQAEVPRGGGSWAQRLRRETHPSFPSRNILAFLSNILSYRLLWRNGGANLSPQPTLQVCTPLRLAGGLFNFLFFTCKKKK